MHILRVFILLILGISIAHLYPCVETEDGWLCGRRCKVLYGAWGLCSATCGKGRRVRNGIVVTGYKKHCPPIVASESCEEKLCDELQKEDLTHQDCLVSYNDIGECSASCNGGTRILKGKIVKHNLGDGKPCPHVSQLDKIERCNERPCPPIDCSVQFEPFSECTVSCGGGIKVRRGRVLTQAKNGGKACSSLVDRQKCNNSPCPTTPSPPVDCEILYSPWSSCSRSCAGGFQRRTGVILSQAHFGGRRCPHHRQLVKARRCNIDIICPQRTPIDCVVDFVDPFSLCSKSCGNGTQTRWGQVTVRPKDGGQDCPPTVEKRQCNVQPCATPPQPPQDCQIWYGPWSECSASCKSGISKRRQIILQQAKNGGRVCPNQSQLVETRPCQAAAECKQKIPQDCVIEWKPFGTCSVECGGGLRTRRAFVLLTAEPGGKECPPLIQNEQCNVQPCICDEDDKECRRREVQIPQETEESMGLEEILAAVFGGGGGGSVALLIIILLIKRYIRSRPQQQQPQQQQEQQQVMIPANGDGELIDVEMDEDDGELPHVAINPLAQEEQNVVIVLPPPPPFVRRSERKTQKPLRYGSMRSPRRTTKHVRSCAQAPRTKPRWKP